MPSRINKPAANRELQSIPYVGPKIAGLIRELGIDSLEDMAKSDPEKMYRDIVGIYGKMDCCVLYVFRSAVYFARTDDPDPELVKWWNWKK